MTQIEPRPIGRGPARTVSPGAAIALAFQLVIRQLATRGRIVALTLLALIAPVSGFALGAADADLEAATIMISSVGLGAVVPIVSLVFGGAALGDLRDDKTLVYVWLRPMARWPVVIGAALAAATLTAPITLVPLLAASLLTGVGSGIVVGTLIAGVVGIVGYVSLFTLCGVWLKRFIVWGLAYILIWEGFISQAGVGVARFALLKYTRSILVDRTGIDLDLGDFSMAVGIVVPLIASMVLLALAAYRLARQDID